MGHVAPPNRYAGVALAVRLLALITRRAQSLAELAAALGVGQRTIRRLIDALRAGGIRIDQARVPPETALRYRAHTSTTPYVGHCLGCGRALTRCGIPSTMEVKCDKCNKINTYESSRSPVSAR